MLGRKYITNKSYSIVYAVAHDKWTTFKINYSHHLIQWYFMFHIIEIIDGSNKKSDVAKTHSLVQISFTLMPSP